MAQTRRVKRRSRWPLLLLIVAVAVAASIWYLVARQGGSEEPSAPVVQTAKVRVGDITITASGSGNLLPAREARLGFRTGGVLAAVAVQVGDRVATDDMLARLDDADAQAQVAQASVSLRLAELKLSSLTRAADPVALATTRASLAAAQADLSRLLTPAGESELLAAQASLQSAQEALAQLLSGPDPEKVRIAEANVTLAEINVRAAQAAYDRVAARGDPGATREAAELWQATTNYERAQAEYQEALTGPTADAIAAARAKVALSEAQLQNLLAEPAPDAVAAAEAKVVQVQTQLEALLAGASAEDLEAAELGVTLARSNLENAGRQLAATELRAPFAGTVVAVGAGVAESVGTAPFITLAALDTPLVRFWLEETDLMSAARGNRVEIVFDALPDQVFTGTIELVDPALAQVGTTPVVQVWASVDLASHAISLLSGMTADVVVVAGEAKDALLVPVQALREATPGKYSVFVVKADGKLELRPVEVGLKDFANAQILAGLQKGDVVSTGTVDIGSD